jgi:hypothetical protein
MDSFLTMFTDHEADAIAYADDGALIIVATNIESAELHMQNPINKAHTWATDHGLEFSIPKTKAMIFSRRRNPPTLTVPLTINGHDIEVVPVFKYLGVTLDSKLYWNAHIMNKTKNAKKHLMLLHRGIGSTLGTSPAITLWLYTGIVRPALTYGVRWQWSCGTILVS